MQNIFYTHYKNRELITDGIYGVIDLIYSIYNIDSFGLAFLFGKSEKRGRSKGVSPLKRWNMFLRWMARKDALDMGLWEKIDKKNLIIPLDTHTHKVSLELGLIDRKSYDLHSALLLTNKLREFSLDDPIKYDFALYRIGQEKILLK